MPIIKSSKKRAKQNDKRHARLKPFKSTMLTLVKNIQKLVHNHETNKAEAILPVAYKAIDTAAKKNIIHKNTASRKKSLIQKLVNKGITKDVTEVSAKKTTAKTTAKTTTKTTAKTTSTAKAEKIAESQITD